MITSSNIVLTSGVIIVMLISASVISYTSKFLFTSNNSKPMPNYMYDPDQGLNISHICTMAKGAYRILYEKTPCYNKTLFQWYNPWLKHKLWTGFWNEIKARNRLKRIKDTKVKMNQTEEIERSNDKVVPTDVPIKINNNSELLREKIKPNQYFYTILFGLVVISGVFALWEACKDKLTKNAAAAGKAQDRQCSLADFTINRHLRRESQQQSASHFQKHGPLEMTAKVTQNLIHQSSLDRAFPKTISEALTSSDSRRNSVPVYLNTEIPPTGGPSSPKLRLNKRQSVDVSGEEINLDIKKKPRFFIRRH